MHSPDFSGLRTGKRQKDCQKISDLEDIITFHTLHSATMESDLKTQKMKLGKHLESSMSKKLSSAHSNVPLCLHLPKVEDENMQSTDAILKRAFITCPISFYQFKYHKSNKRSSSIST